MSSALPTVLIFIPWFSPAYKAGGPIRSIANLVEGGEGETRYRIICSNKDLDGAILPVEADRWLSFNACTQVWYSAVAFPKEGEASGPATVLLINGIYSWPYNLKPVLFSKAGRIIVSVRGMLHPGALSQKAGKKKLYLRLWKILGLQRKVEFHAADAQEKDHIRAVFGPLARVHIAANLPRVLQKQPVREKRAGVLNLVTIALVSPMKNILPVLQALKKLEATVQFRLYGPVKDQAYWKCCQELLPTLPANIRFSYGGDIHPDQVPAALEKGDVFILPSKSENFGHALFEALSAGKPVITSQSTPWNGLKEARAGWNVKQADAESLAAAIAFFAAMERRQLEKWSEGARRYSEQAIDEAEIRDQYRRMFAPKNPPEAARCR